MRRESTVSVSEDDEALSTVTGYVLHLGVAITVIGIMLMNMHGTMGYIRESTTEKNLRMAGESIAERIVEADTLSNRGSNPEGSLELRLPNVGETYTVEIEPDPGVDGTGEIKLDSGVRAATVTVEYNTVTQTDSAEFGSGSEVTMHYTEEEIELREG